MCLHNVDLRKADPLARLCEIWADLELVFVWGIYIIHS